MNGRATSRSVLRAAWQQYRNVSGMGFLYVLGGVLTVGLLAVAVWVPSGGLLAKILGLSVLSVFVLCAWTLLVSTLLLQNHPHVARLVPGHMAALRRVLTGAWLLFTGLVAIIGWGFGHGLAAAVGAGLGLLLWAWILRAPLFALLCAFVVAGCSFWAANHAYVLTHSSAWKVVEKHPEAVVAGVLVATLTVAALTVGGLFQAGGARHVANYRARVRMLAAQFGAGMTQEQWRGVGGLGAVLAYLPDLLYRRSLKRSCELGGGTVLDRAALGLGPTLHWTGQVGFLVFLGVFWAVLSLPMTGFGTLSAASQTSVNSGIAYGSAFFAIGVAMRSSAAMYATRREQALLMLLPGMPRGGVLNRQLALRLLALFLGSWTMTIVVVLAVTSRLVGTADWPVIVAFAVLPAGIPLWRDWSRAPPPTAGSSNLPLLIVMLLAPCGIALQVWQALSIWLVAAVFTGVALVLLAWRWRVLSNAPSAFPVGRLHEEGALRSARSE